MFLEVLIFSALAILVGLAFTFMGYRLFRVLLPIWAFFVGLFFGVSAITALMGGSFLSSSLGLILGFFIGLVLAAISYFAYSFAVVLFGATLGFALGQGFMQMLGLDGVLSFVAGIALAIAFAALFVFGRMPRLIIVLATAFGGAMAIIMGIFVLFGVENPEFADLAITKTLVGNSFLWTVFWIVLGVIGTSSQYAMEKEMDLMKVYVWEDEFDKPLTMDEVKEDLGSVTKTPEKTEKKK